MNIKKEVQTLNMKPFPLLSQEVGEWSRRNFGNKQNPYLGMVEELGELAHCLLKREQGIRGFENPEFFREEFVDALGDIGIYAANFAFNNHINVQWPIVGRSLPQNTQTRYIANAAYWLSQLMLTPEVEEDLKRWLHHFLVEMALVAKLENLELEEIVCGVWQRVKVRDWKRNRQDGETETAA
jgi:hypothetical protein